MSKKKYIIEGKEVVTWITRGGKRIPIFEGGSNDKETNKIIDEVNSNDVYHGTTANFEEINSDTGNYFTLDENYAKNYTKEVIYDKSGAYKGKVDVQGARIIKSRIKITRPLLFGRGYESPTLENYYKLTPIKIDGYKKRGYDSLVFVKNGKAHEIVVFDKNQIKIKR